MIPSHLYLNRESGVCDIVDASEEELTCHLKMMGDCQLREMVYILVRRMAEASSKTSSGIMVSLSIVEAINKILNDEKLSPGCSQVIDIIRGALIEAITKDEHIYSNKNWIKIHASMAVAGRFRGED